MTEFRRALSDPARRLALRGSISLPTGRGIALTGADIVSLTIDEGVGDGLLPGAVLSAQHVLELASAGGAWLPGGERLVGDALKGATVRLWLQANGEEAALCTFVVRDAKADARGGAAVVSGYDSLYEETAGSFADALTYPATLLGVTRHILSHARYPEIAALPNGGAVIEKKPSWGRISVRQALGYALAMAGAFARVDRSGALEIVPVKRPGAEIAEIGDAEVLSRTHEFSDFGPLNSLRAETVRGEDGEGEAAEILARDNPSQPLSAAHSLDMGANPLLVAGSAQAENLLMGALGALRGLEQRRASFRFRGDPTLMIGDGVRVDGTVSLLTRQKIALARSLSAECELGAPDTGLGTLRAITPEGGLNAARLVGVVDGGLLAVGSVSAGAIRAGSIVAEKLAAGSVVAEKIAAGAVGAEKLDALTVDAKFATIAQAEIGGAVIDGAQIRDATIGTAKVQDASITGAKIGEAQIGTAKIALGAITTALIQNGAIGAAQIADASITGAKIVSLNADVISAGTLSVERLLLKGENGLYHAINATDAGLTTEQLTEEEYRNRISGTVLAAKSVTAEKIAAETITANEIAAGTITSDKVDIVELFAADAVIDRLETYDIRNGDQISLTVGGVRQMILKATEAGIRFGRNDSNYSIRIDDDSIDFLQTGAPIAQLSADLLWAKALAMENYAKIGAYMLRKTADGGVGFAM